ncbi:MAG: phosphoribosylamine--glycine ligase [Dehalococcoidia bacterium]|nr:phosphoribosylamine--glycine ligase [Dehalococcoidia bacterium]
MNILIIGSGAREHALAWVIRKNPAVEQLFVAPGNAGTVRLAQNIRITPTDIKTLGEAAQSLNIDLVVVGPENSLALGIVDHFQTLGIPIFGPSQAAAQIEASKVFAKELMLKYGIPCAKSRTFTSLNEAKDYVKSQEPPTVVKADGLAAGKGVIIAQSHQEAQTALSDIMEKRAFGAAGDRILVEECLSGQEVSLLAFTDGKTVVPMVPACDYKRRDDNDEGPNTGGMGGYSPPGFFDETLIKQVQTTVLEPVVAAMAHEGRTYKGVLYAGLMLTDEGPKVLEFNARFGDPETQVILPRLETDLVEIMLAVVSGNLDKIRIKWSTQACVGVVMSSGGYPGNYKTGFPIQGLDALPPEIMVFHAGTRQGATPGIVLTDGGRVLTVVAKGDSIAHARSVVYQHLPRIQFEGCHYRKDIATREVNR